MYLMSAGVIPTAFSCGSMVSSCGLRPTDGASRRSEAVRHRGDDVVRARVEHHPALGVLDQMGVGGDVDRSAGRDRHVRPRVEVTRVSDAALQDIEPLRVSRPLSVLGGKRPGDVGCGTGQHEDRRSNDYADSLHRVLHAPHGADVSTTSRTQRAAVEVGAAAVSSFFTTTPPFITNLTRSISLTSFSGSPATPMMSAYLPFSMLPTCFAQS